MKYPLLRIRKPVVQATFILALVLAVGTARASVPSVDGRFYGDGDHLRYGIPYAESAGGSKLYVTLVDKTVYVALVVDRYVNDNVFSSVRNYRQSAGWSANRTAPRLFDSEYAEFSFAVGDGGSWVEWTWNHGYAGVLSGEQDNTREDWVSGLGVAGGSAVGTDLPPGLVMASSLQWNLNNYAYRVNRSIPAGWNMGTATAPDSWTSPITNPSNPDNVINAAEGYPGPQGNPPFGSTPIGYSPTYQWEWSMVYEWSVDLSSYETAPVFIVSGKSHHSPAKNGDEDDPFTLPPLGDSPPLMDFTDLPLPYPQDTSHALDPNGVRLGMSVTSEPQPLSNSTATGDSYDDGVVFLTPLRAGSLARVAVTIRNGDPERTTGGYLSAFMDFNGDGVLTPIGLVSAIVPEGADPIHSGPVGSLSGSSALFDGADPLPPGPIADLHLSKPGTYELAFLMPPDTAGWRASMWRITNGPDQGGNAIDGMATSGEVETYMMDDPLLVTLDAFEASAAAYGDSILIRWSTGAEWDNAGFRVYRAIPQPNGSFVKGDPVSPDIIPAAGTEIQGADYELVDPLPLNHDETRHYFLEDLDMMGTSTLHGPTQALVSQGRNAISSIPDWMRITR